MDKQGQFAASEHLNSFNRWWELAGVDMAVGDYAIDWLVLDERPDLAAPEQAVLRPDAQTKDDRKLEWPQDIATLRSMIADGAALPGNGYGSSRAVPVGTANARLVIVSDLPDTDELSEGELGSGATGILLKAMLAAIGVRLSDCYWTALATTSPATGDLPDDALPELAEFIRHQINLVDPETIFVFGASTCRALLGQELMTARKSMQLINYIGGMTPALTTFHPRTLSMRPSMKAEAWKDLQMLAKRNLA